MWGGPQLETLVTWHPSCGLNFWPQQRPCPADVQSFPTFVEKRQTLMDRYEYVMYGKVS
jgi:hypothetical protein